MPDTTSMRAAARYAYLASPYNSPDAGVRASRVTSAAEAAALLLRHGVATFSPIAHSAPIVAAGGPTDHDTWMTLDLALIAGAAWLIALELPGWEHSAGMREEMARARELGIPVIAMSPGVMPEALKGVSDAVR